MKKESIFGYVPYSITSYDFIGNKTYSKPLNESVFNVYNVNIFDLVSVYLKANPQDNLWPSSNNVAMSKKQLRSSQNGLNPFCFTWETKNYSGHSMERSLKIYYIINEIKNSYIKNKLIHHQLDSHETQHKKNSASSKLQGGVGNIMLQIAAAYAYSKDLTKSYFSAKKELLLFTKILSHMKTVF